jgi:hypothetical protein
MKNSLILTGIFLVIPQGNGVTGPLAAGTLRLDQAFHVEVYRRSPWASH